MIQEEFEKLENIRNQLIALIEHKDANRIPLTVKEQYFKCENLRFDQLLLHPACLDAYYRVVYLHQDAETNEKFPVLRDRDQDYFRGLVREWEQEMNKTSHDDVLMHISAKETREELRKLRAGYSFFRIQSSSEDYSDLKFDILAWSKYRYILIKRIFELEIGSDFYLLKLNGIDIRFDYFSYAHILTRHYAHGLKPYTSDKSHFYGVFGHSTLHLQLEAILRAIDESGYYVHDDIKEINFRFRGDIYKIYCTQETKYTEGVSGPQVYNRLSTFFRVERENMLHRLSTQFEERIIDQELTIYIKL
jgi:hypothetical protein